jgi:hypothetical protein
MKLKALRWKALGAAAGFAALAAAAFAQPYAPYGVQYGGPGGPYGGPYKKGPPPSSIPAKQEDRERAAPPPGRPPFERMSPEERGQLRRDIERHGREIYPDPRRDRRR